MVSLTVFRSLHIDYQPFMGDTRTRRSVHEGKGNETDRVSLTGSSRLQQERNNVSKEIHYRVPVSHNSGYALRNNDRESIRSRLRDSGKHTYHHSDRLMRGRDDKSRYMRYKSSRHVLVQVMDQTQQSNEATSAGEERQGKRLASTIVSSDFRASMEAIGNDQVIRALSGMEIQAEEEDGDNLMVLDDLFDEELKDMEEKHDSGALGPLRSKQSSKYSKNSRSSNRRNPSLEVKKYEFLR
ncbi:unnamed protein product [Eruca vesicaria subsp. sativa]|uniref:Uncharacterized protein n=1 Tax=Eruca vesicaria subsp. sativa TaxID=29727 RepID=A0ABC8IUM2_ERUVS|nr:unnamed protein product [Eruca vesicaria subsp. sativa]